MKEKEVVEENEEEEEGISKFCDIHHIYLDKQIEYSLKTEKTPSRRSVLARPFGHWGAWFNSWCPEYAMWSVGPCRCQYACS